jgi:hypothetical protein
MTVPRGTARPILVPPSDQAGHRRREIAWRAIAAGYAAAVPPALAQLAVLVAVAAAIVWPAPIDPTRLPGVFVTSDLVMSHWPSALLIKETVASAHRLPLWNPHYGGGRPLAADPLAALWYPPTHLVHFLTVRNYLLTMEMGHLVLAGAGMLVLGRAALRLSRSPRWWRRSRIWRRRG